MLLQVSFPFQSEVSPYGEKIKCSLSLQMGSYCFRLAKVKVQYFIFQIQHKTHQICVLVCIPLPASKNHPCNTISPSQPLNTVLRSCLPVRCRLTAAATEKSWATNLPSSALFAIHKIYNTLITQGITFFEWRRSTCVTEISCTHIQKIMYCGSEVIQAIKKAERAEGAKKTEQIFSVTVFILTALEDRCSGQYLGGK